MTITKSGALASFYTVNKAPIKHLRVYFSPKQAGSGTASPENVREISGWDSIDVHTAGKNLFNIDFFKNADNVIVKDNTISGNVVPIHNITYKKLMPLKIPKGSTFTTRVITYRNVADTGAGWSFWFIYSNGERIRPFYTSNAVTTPTEYKGTLTAQEDIIGLDFGYYNQALTGIWYISDIQIEINNNDTIYEKSQYNFYNVNWSDTLGTIYGGYIDLITGELVQEWDGVTHIWQNGEDQTTDDETKLKKRFRLNYPPISGGTNNISNVLNYGYGGTYVYNVSTSSSGGKWAYITVPTDVSTNLEIQLIYKLATPITHQLSPQSLATLIGRNNIWSNADRIEVEYDLAESNDELYRRRNILLNTPHIETINDNIAVFNTDMIAPIKEARAYFNCRKENGTPSLTSPKQVLSRTNMEVYSYGENLFNINTDVVGSRYVDYTTGNLISWGSSWNASTFIAIEPNTVYTLRCSNSGLSVAGFAFYDSTQTYISGIRNNHSSSVPTATTTFTTPSNAAYIRFTFVEPLNYLTVLVKGESIPNLNTYSADWSEIGELYGGYVDLVNGNLYKTYNRRNLKDYTFGYYTTYQYYLTCSDRKKTSTNLLSNLFPISTTTGYPQVNKTLGYYSNGASYADIIFIRYEDAGEGVQSSSFNSWLQSLENNPYIVYEMAEPEYVATLTPYSLKSLRGKNFIQGNGRGPVSIKYWTH